MQHLFKHPIRFILISILFLVKTQAFSQCSDCNHPTVITSLPYTDTNTTCGKCNNFSSADACSGQFLNYLNGDDMVYTYTPSSTEIVDFVISDNDNYTGIFIMDACPSDPNANCIADHGVSLGRMAHGGVTLNGGTTYYIIISSWPAPQCVNYTLNVFQNTPVAPCNQDTSSNNCSTATLICNSNSYCGTTGSYTIDSWNGLSNAFYTCANGVIHNNSFLEFVADSSIAVFSMLADNCTFLSELQIMVFDNVCNGTVNPYACYGRIMTSVQTQTFFASGLTPGNTYKIMIDGESGASCNFSIQAISGVIVSSEIGTATDTTICEGENITLTATGNAPYLWSPGGETTPTITVSPTSTSLFTVSSSGSCDTIIDSTTVTVVSPPNAGNNDTINICDNGSPIHLIDSLEGAPVNGGTWSPSLTNGTDVFDPSVDTSGIYTYIVSNSSCPADSATLIVNVANSPNAGSYYSIGICNDDSPVHLFDSLRGTPDSGGIWNPSLSSGTDLFDPSIDTPGNYTYTVSGLHSCSDTATISISMSPPPIANFTTDIQFENFIIYLTNLSTGATYYEWNIGELMTTTLHPSYNITETGELNIQLIAFSANNCSDTMQIKVNIDNESSIYIPNTFTPNNDGTNDTFNIIGTHLNDFTLQIFNRWGELVFQSNEMNTGWDGSYKGIKPVQTETYIWKIQYTDQLDVTQTIYGKVTLLI